MAGPDRKKYSKEAQEEIEDLEGIVNNLKREKITLQNQLQEKDRAIYKLETRLDACLYAMVTFQEIIKKLNLLKADPDMGFKYNQDTNTWSVTKDVVALAT